MTTPDYAQQITALAQRLDRLLETTRKLAHENQQIKQQLSQVQGSHQQLQTKSELAKQRVQGMLSRLNELEQGDE